MEDVILFGAYQQNTTVHKALIIISFSRMNSTCRHFDFRGNGLWHLPFHRCVEFLQMYRSKASQLNTTFCTGFHHFSWRFLSKPHTYCSHLGFNLSINLTAKTNWKRQITICFQQKYISCLFSHLENTLPLNNNLSASILCTQTGQSVMDRGGGRLTWHPWDCCYGADMLALRNRPTARQCRSSAFI